MGKLYRVIDRIWQWIAEKVFVRFDFDIPIEKLRTHPPHLVIFTLPYVGIIEFLIISSWCRKQGLPGIAVSNRKRILFLAKPVFFFKVLFGRTTYADLFLSSEPGPRLLFCPTNERTRVLEPVPVEQLLKELYAAKATATEPEKFQFFPMFVLWRKHVRGASRKPSEYLLGLGSDPNLLGKFWYLGRQRKDSVVKALDDFPMLSQLEGTDTLNEGDAMRFARQTRRRILVETHREMRVILGPRYASPHSVKETILRDPEVQKVIEEVATKENVDRKKIMSRAYGDLTEIVSNYRYRTIEFLYVVLRWFFNKVFDGVSLRDEQITNVREQMRAKPLVFVSCHRSHLDYLVIPYILFEHDMVTPHIAAGINLSFWPFGPIARTAGAFFIRRSFRGDVLYSTALRKYVEYLLTHRFNIKFFIEGTRSRSGKMLPPAYGILKMVTEAQRRKVVDDIALMPVSITYDEVPEERSYSREIAGGQKVKESAKALLKSRDIVKRNFGKVYVRFGSVVSAKEANGGSLKPEEVTLSLQKAAFQLCKNANDTTPVTAKSIIASVFLGHSETSLSLEEILHHSTMMAEYVLASGHELSVPDTQAFRRSVEQIVRRLAKSGVFQLTETAVPRRYICDRKRRTSLAFYKNNGIHCFVIPAIALTAFFKIARSSDQQSKCSAMLEQWKTECFELRNWLKFDFFFSPRLEFLNEIESALTYFFGLGYQDRSLSDVVSKLSTEKLSKLDDALIFARLVEDLFESYLTLAHFAEENATAKFDRKSLLAKLPKYGEQLMQKKEIVLPESLSVQNYSNALLLLENLKGIKNLEEGGKRLMQFEENAKGVSDLKIACQKYLIALREEIPNYLKPHRSASLPDLRFSH